MNMNGIGTSVGAGAMDGIYKGPERRSVNAAGDASVGALAEFVSNMGHHLRTPLTVVLGMAKLLKITQLDAEQDEAVQMIDRSGEELLGHINQLIDAIELANGQVRLVHAPFDLRAMLEKVAARTDSAARAKGLEAQFYVAPDVPRRIFGDEIRLRDVLTNLCDNAVKFTPAGKVSLTVESPRDPAQVRRAEFMFTVADSGIGMDAHAARRAFDPFFQADSSVTKQFPGAGLGLMIVRHLVRLMGGAVSVQSAPGKGSTFTVSVAFDLADAREPMHA